MKKTNNFSKMTQLLIYGVRICLPSIGILTHKLYNINAFKGIHPFISVFAKYILNSLIAGSEPGLGTN